MIAGAVGQLEAPQQGAAMPVKLVEIAAVVGEIDRGDPDVPAVEIDPLDVEHLAIELERPDQPCASVTGASSCASVRPSSASYGAQASCSSSRNSSESMYMPEW